MLRSESIGTTSRADFQPLKISCASSRLPLLGMSFGSAGTTVIIGGAGVVSLTLSASLDRRHTIASLRERLLGRVGHAAADGEKQHLDRDLTARFRRGSISPVFYYRCLARITQEELAARSGTRQSYLSQIEKRRRPLTWKQAEKIAPHLGVSTGQLMEKSDGGE